MADTEMIKTSKKMCIACKWGYRFNGSSDAFCDYYGITGKRRGCPIGWCNKYEPYEGIKYRETFRNTMKGNDGHNYAEDASRNFFEV